MVKPLTVTSSQAAKFTAVRDYARFHSIGVDMTARDVDAIVGTVVPQEFQPILTYMLSKGKPAMVAVGNTALDEQAFQKTVRDIMAHSTAVGDLSGLRALASELGIRETLADLGLPNNGVASPTHNYLAVAPGVQTGTLTARLTAERQLAADFIDRYAAFPIERTSLQSLAGWMDAQFPTMLDTWLHEMAHHVDWWLPAQEIADLHKVLDMIPISMYSEVNFSEIITEHFVLLTLAPDKYRAAWPEAYAAWQTLARSLPKQP